VLLDRVTEFAFRHSFVLRHSSIVIKSDSPSLRRSSCSHRPVAGQIKTKSKNSTAHRAVATGRGQARRTWCGRYLNYFFFRFPPVGTPVALIRLAWVGSIPIVTLTVMPGLSAAMVALCPFTVISVNCVIVNALVVFSSVTVIVFPATLEITGGRYFGAAEVFFFLLPAKAGAVANTTSRMETITNSLFFTVSVLTKPEKK
jgi:hypothetical protein